MENMNLFHAFIFGVVEGASEFLPISSTAHLILTAHLLNLPQTESLKSFEIIIQLGAILSVLVLYWRSFLIKWEELKRVACAFVPTAMIGFLLYKVIKNYFFEELNIILGALFIGGIILILFERGRGKNSAGDTGVGQIPYRKAFLIGLCQALAVIPGVSRSGATIVGGVLLGVERKTAVEFSFLLAVPTMAAATFLDILKNPEIFSKGQWSVLVVGFVTSFAVAFLCIQGLLAFVKNHTFVGFGVYRIILAVIFGVFLLGS